MIPRYTNPAMGALWNDQRRFETWLAVELAAADVMAEAGIVPADAARELRARAKFDVARIDEIEKTTQHDVIAFTTAVAEHVGPAARWLHFGLTSSDVVDTALALQMRDATDLILELLGKLRERRRTPARLLSVALSNFDDGRRQLGLFGEETSVIETERDREISKAVDAVRSRFGRNALKPGRLIDE